MQSRKIRRLLAVLIVATAASGCATNYKERIAVLEQTNANLTERVNRMRGQLDGVDRARDELDRQLIAAREEVDALRNRPAEMPTPQETAPGWTAVPGGAMIAIEGSVLFAPGKVTIRQESRRTLDTVASTLNGEYADRDILVFGHTDDLPIKKSGWTDNWQLSTERSLAVVRYLREHGVSPDRLVPCGCGEHRPRVDNVSDGNRAQNRRVEIFAVDPQLRLGRS